MQNTDIIFINVTGTNGTTRKQATVTRKFNGAGQSLNDQGQPDGSGHVLRNLPTGDGTSASIPAFPVVEFEAARLSKDVERMKALQIAYGEQLAKHEAANGGSNEQAKLVASAINYLVEFHGFSVTDAQTFVVKPENLDVTVSKLPDSRAMYGVVGTAIFG